MNDHQHTLCLRALPGCTATPTFEHLPCLDYTLIRLPPEHCVGSPQVVAEVRRNGAAVKFRQDGRHLMCYPGFRLEGDRIAVVVHRGNSSLGSKALQAPGTLQATTPLPSPRSARGGPIEPHYGLSPRET